MTVRPVPALRLLWALPCSLLGLALGLPLLLAGGRARRVGRQWEIALRADDPAPGSPLRRLPFAAITFGHVVLGVSAPVLARLRSHEAAHVRQYERWGALFLLAYPAAGLWAWLRGGRPYHDNPFERQACAEAADPAAGAASPPPCEPGGS